MTILETDPPELAQIDHQVDAELHADDDRECRSKLTNRDGIRFCFFLRGHAGPCSWAVDR